MGSMAPMAPLGNCLGCAYDITTKDALVVSTDIISHAPSFDALGLGGNFALFSKSALAGISPDVGIPQNDHTVRHRILAGFKDTMGYSLSDRIHELSDSVYLGRAGVPAWRDGEDLVHPALRAHKLEVLARTDIIEERAVANLALRLAEQAGASRDRMRSFSETMNFVNTNKKIEHGPAILFLLSNIAYFGKIVLRDAMPGGVPLLVAAAACMVVTGAVWALPMTLRFFLGRKARRSMGSSFFHNRRDMQNRIGKINALIAEYKDVFKIFRRAVGVNGALAEHDIRLDNVDGRTLSSVI